MPLPVIRTLRLAGIVAAALWLAACSAEPQAPPKAPELLSRKEAAQRTVVPFTRQVSLAKAGPLVEVEFELPPPGPNSVPELMIGLRVSGATAKEMRATSTFVTADPIQARVLLRHLVEGQEVPVSLVRSSTNLRERLALDALGNVPRTSITSVDDNPLREAGLFDEDRFYDVLALARMENARPGRYRLSIENAVDHPALAGQEVELLVACHHGAK